MNVLFTEETAVSILALGLPAPPRIPCRFSKGIWGDLDPQCICECSDWATIPTKVWFGFKFSFSDFRHTLHPECFRVILRFEAWRSSILIWLILSCRKFFFFNLLAAAAPYVHHPVAALSATLSCTKLLTLEPPPPPPTLPVDLADFPLDLEAGLSTAAAFLYLSTGLNVISPLS